MSRRERARTTPRQYDPEETSLTLLTLQLDPSAVHLDRPSRRRQAKPRPPASSNGLGRHAGRSARRSAPDAPQKCPNPVSSTPIAAAPEGVSAPRREPSLRGRVFDRVIEHVDQAQSQDGGIARGSTLPPRHSIGHALLLLLGEHSEMLHDAHRQTTQIDYVSSAGWIRPDSTPRQRQETLHQPRQAVDLLEHASDDLAVARCTEGTLQRHSPTLRIAVSGVRSSWRRPL